MFCFFIFAAVYPGIYFYDTQLVFTKCWGMENICLLINKYSILASRLYSNTLEHKIVSNTGPLGSHMCVPSSDCRIWTIEGLHKDGKTSFSPTECKLSNTSLNKCLLLLFSTSVRILEGCQGISVGKDICCQSWWTEFHTQSPYSEKREQTTGSSLTSTHMPCGAVCTKIINTI